MDIRQSIADLLAQHDCVIVPGFGGFIGNPAPAWIDPLRHVFHPPSKKLIFNVHLKQNDGLLANAVAAREGVSYADACRFVDEFAEQCRASLLSGDSVRLSGIGQLLPGPGDIVFFEQEPDTDLLPDAFGLVPVMSPPVGPVAATPSQTLAPVEGTGRIVRMPAVRLTLRWAAALALPAGIAAMIAFARLGTLPEGPESQAGILGSVFSRFSSASLVMKKEAPRVVTITRPAVQPLKQVAELPPVAREASPAAAGDRFAVIVGAFRFRENADRLVAELQAKGAGAIIYDQSKTGLYRVAIGTATGRAQAMDLLASAKSMSYAGAWILVK